MVLPYFDTFETKFEQKENQVVYKRIPADLDTAVSVMLKLTQAKKKFISIRVGHWWRD